LKSKTTEMHIVQRGSWVIKSLLYSIVTQGNTDVSELITAIVNYLVCYRL
jgi:hypothetical protein